MNMHIFYEYIMKSVYYLNGKLLFNAAVWVLVNVNTLQIFGSQVLLWIMIFIL